MKVKGLSIQELRDIVTSVSNSDYDGNLVFKREPEQSGNFVLFTLTVRNSAEAGGRRSHTGRRIAAACWHAHRDIMIKLFDEHPDALLVSAFARYDGKDDFNYQFESTGDRNIGSIAQPMAMQDACDCC